MTSGQGGAWNWGRNVQTGAFDMLLRLLRELKRTDRALAFRYGRQSADGVGILGRGSWGGDLNTECLNGTTESRVHIAEDRDEGGTRRRCGNPACGVG